MPDPKQYYPQPKEVKGWKGQLSQGMVKDPANSLKKSPTVPLFREFRMIRGPDIEQQGDQGEQYPDAGTRPVFV
jgi:hypothetical protein